MKLGRARADSGEVDCPATLHASCVNGEVVHLDFLPQAIHIEDFPLLCLRGHDIRCIVVHKL